MGKINRAWNDKGRRLSYWERRWTDPLYKFREEVFYTTELSNHDYLLCDLPKPDKYGIYHGINL